MQRLISRGLGIVSLRWLRLALEDEFLADTKTTGDDAPAFIRSFGIVASCFKWLQDVQVK